MTVNIPKVKQFLKHMHTAETVFQKRDKVRKKLNQQLKSLPKAKSVNSKLDLIDKHIQELLQHELTLAQGQTAEDKINQEMKQKIEHLEATLIKTQAEDTEIIVQLRNKISDLNNQVKNYSRTNDGLLQDFKNLVNQASQTLTSGKELGGLKENLVNITNSIQKVKGSNSVPDYTLDKLEKFQDQFKESVTKGLMPLSKLQEDISDLKQVLADLLDKLTDRDNRIQNIEKKIHKDTKKKEMHEQLKTFEQKLQRLPAGTADHLHERLAIIKGTPKPTNDLPLPIPPMPTNNKNINSHDLEFSSGGSHDLSPLGDLDIPPPPKVKKKGLFSKLLGK